MPRLPRRIRCFDDSTCSDGRHDLEDPREAKITRIDEGTNQIQSNVIGANLVKEAAKLSG